MEDGEEWRRAICEVGNDIEVDKDSLDAKPLTDLVLSNPSTKYMFMGPSCTFEGLILLYLPFFIRCTFGHFIQQAQYLP